MLNEHMLWVERYRPHSIKDCILPKDLKAIFQSFIDKNQVPNMLLSGGPGMGKTTVARALCDELQMDYIFLNGSKERTLDVFRGKVSDYASSVSLTGGRKVIIIDEADKLHHDSQDALRGIIEEFAGNCSFVFTCNHKNKLIEAIRSRLPDITFKFSKDEVKSLAGQFFKAAEKILSDQGIPYDKDALASLIIKFFPDFRRVLGELQKYAMRGSIDAGVLKQLDAAKIDNVVAFLRDKNFKDLRVWVGNNLDNDVTQVIHEVYLRLNEFVEPQFIPAAVVLIGKYLDYCTRTLDPEVNLMACFSEIMLECSMKAR